MGITLQYRSGHQGYENGYEGFFGGPNSAGGVSVQGRIKNTGTKTIKYITIRFIPYNSVNDPVYCSIKGVSLYGVKCTGPISPEGKLDFLGENLWYNSSITVVKLAGVEIEYMDGTTETLQGNEVTIEPYSGCYVATAVYGSYDCPQVWTLRRYRDNILASTWYGRAFIHTYYAISPTLVKWFGHTEWFKKMWKGKLDSMVKKLQNEGVESTPYEDKNW